MHFKNINFFCVYVEKANSYFVIFIFFFFKQKTAYEISECDWSPDVCSSDRSEEHTSELQSHSEISYAVFCLKKKKNSGADDVTVGTDDLTFTGDSNVSTAVTDNTVTISVDFAATQTNIDAVETRRADNVFFTYNSTGDQANVIVNAANVEPSQNNIFSLGAPDKVWKELYVGPGSINLGNVTLSAVETGLKIEDAQGATTQLDTSVANVAANLNLIQDNVAQVSQDVSDLESRRADNVTIRIDAFTGTNTAIVAAESRVNSNLDVTNDNVVTLTTTVDNFGT